MTLPDDIPTSPTLIHRIQQGEAEAWKRFIPLYDPLVRFWCGKWGLKRKNELDDLTQEIWLAVGTAISGYDWKTSFRGWLRGVAYHKVQDWYRLHYQDSLAIGGSTALKILSQIQADPEDSTDPQVEEQMQALFLRAIAIIQAEFPNHMWQAFIACVVDDRPATEVAHQLGLEPANVRMIKIRILNRLRHELGEKMNP